MGICQSKEDIITPDQKEEEKVINKIEDIKFGKPGLRVNQDEAFRDNYRFG